MGEYKNFKLYIGRKNEGRVFSVLISECIIEDIDVMMELKDKNYNNRYVDALIRNMCEQVIEYIYLMKHSELIEVYFGKNLHNKMENIDEESQDKELFKCLKETGKARFGNRASVKKMAKDIGEFECYEKKIPLYEIFCIKAELEHNSYFHHIFELVDEIEGWSSEEIEGDYMYLIFILTSFMDIYDTV